LAWKPSSGVIRWPPDEANDKHDRSLTFEVVMRLPLLAASVLVFAAVVGSPEARAFVMDDQSGNSNDGSPRFVDPDENSERLTGPTGSYPAAVPGRSVLPFGENPSVPTLPSAAQPGAGEHGFTNNRRYR
jgi:hypothetical protein